MTNDRGAAHMKKCIALWATRAASAWAGLAVADTLAAAAAGQASAANGTLVVPRDYPTIQAAVNAAAPGDTLMVRPGTYTEEVVIGKDLDLRGAGVGATVI